MTRFTQLLVVVMFCAMMMRANGQVMMAPATPTVPQASYPPMATPSRTIIPSSSMGAQQVLSQPQLQPPPATMTKSNPQAMMAPINTTYTPTSTQELRPAQSSYALNNKPGMYPTTMAMNDTMMMAHPKPEATPNLDTLSQTQVSKNPVTPTAVGGNAIISEIENERGLNRSSSMMSSNNNNNSMSAVEKVRNPVIPAVQSMVAGGMAAYQAVNRGNMSATRVNMTMGGGQMMGNLTNNNNNNNNMEQQSMNSMRPVQTTEGISNMATASGLERLPLNQSQAPDLDLNQQIATEKFNNNIEKNPKDDQFTQQLIDQLHSASKMKLNNQQIANQTIFLNSLDSEQKLILESKLKGFQLTPTQQKLERNYLASFVSDKTKAAHQAGFDAIKKSLTPEAQKAFDATEGMQSLELTDEQKYRFEEGSREFLEDPGSRFDSSCSLLSIDLLSTSHLLFILSTVFIFVF